MTRELFKGQDVLAIGRGQCERCKQIVVRVLVADRTWHAAEIGHYGYTPHTCKPTGEAPVRKAA